MKSEDKPIVHFLPIGTRGPLIGHSYYVYALDHPRLGEQDVTTSKVLSVDYNRGSFETVYSRYVMATVTGFEATFSQEAEAATTA